MLFYVSNVACRSSYKYLNVRPRVLLSYTRNYKENQIERK